MAIRCIVSEDSCRVSEYAAVVHLGKVLGPSLEVQFADWSKWVPGCIISKHTASNLRNRREWSTCASAATLPPILLHEADSSAILSLVLLYEADSSAILPTILLYEADFSGILPVILIHETHFAQKWGLAVPPALWASI